MNRSWVRFPQAAQMRPPGTGWAFCMRVRCCLWPHGCSGRRRARPPARLGGLTSFGAAPRSPPVPSGPSGALHTSGACDADGWLGASSRSPARPRRRPRAPQPGPPIPSAPRLEAARALRTPNVVWLVVLGFWGAPLCVVTNVVNRRCFSSGFLIRCYKRRQSDGFFAENSGFWTQIDDVCRSSPVEWCNRFVSFGLGYALSWSGVSSCWVGCGVSRDLVRMSRLR